MTLDNTPSLEVPTMPVELLSIPLPDTADPTKFQEFGREVRGIDPANLSPEEFSAIRLALYKVGPISITRWALIQDLHPQARCLTVS